MPKLLKKISIVSRSLRPQLAIAFSLMSVIPILALLNLIFPSFFPQLPKILIIFISVVISLLGFFLVKRIIDPIIQISSEMKVIANGEVSRKINISRDDEIGILSNALNQMTERIKDNMDELKIYGERTKDINIQINKQVIALSGLLQISNLITKGACIQDVFEITISRLTQVANSSMAFIIFEEEDGFKVAAQYGLEADTLAAMRLAANHYLFRSLFSSELPLKIDSQISKISAEELLKLLNVKNILIYAVLMHGKCAGILGIGNALENFRYSDDDAELMNIFAKQLAIALENNFLSRKIEDLEICDVLTGLYNKRYVVARLDEEILRAISHQQPCGFVAIKLKNLKDLYTQLGNPAAEDTLRKVGDALKAGVGELDRVGRIEDDVFGIVMPEKNKRKAQEMAAQLITKVQLVFQKQDPFKRPILAVSVVENPIDGADAASLLEKVKSSLNE